MAAPVAGPEGPVVNHAEEEEWWDEFWDMLTEDDETIGIVTGMYQYASHIDKYCSRRPYRTPPLSGLEWVNNKLADPEACYDMFRMHPDLFYRLHAELTSNYGLKPSPKSTSIEALAVFLWICGAPQSFRQGRDRFERSMGTVHNLFHKVLKCMVAFAANIIQPRDPAFEHMHTKLLDTRFFPEFQGCIGAIDGTHIPVVVPEEMFTQHLCRKNKTTQNVMAVCDFDMFFTFVLAGWAGSVHDMRVLDNAISEPKWNFPKPPRGTLFRI
jgi:hypothetical protein